MIRRTSPMHMLLESDAALREARRQWVRDGSRESALGLLRSARGHFDFLSGDELRNLCEAAVPAFAPGENYRQLRDLIDSIAVAPFVAGVLRHKDFAANVAPWFEHVATRALDAWLARVGERGVLWFVDRDWDVTSPATPQQRKMIGLKKSPHHAFVLQRGMMQLRPDSADERDIARQSLQAQLKSLTLPLQGVQSFVTDIRKLKETITGGIPLMLSVFVQVDSTFTDIGGVAALFVRIFNRGRR